MIITNAIYFNAEWTNPFDSADTRGETFHLLGGSGTVQVDMMSKSSYQVHYAKFADHSMIALPYKKTDIVMLVLLPHENCAQALDQVAQILPQ